jgi:hypothetical protein
MRSLVVVTIALASPTVVAQQGMEASAGAGYGENTSFGVGGQSTGGAIGGSGSGTTSNTFRIGRAGGCCGVRFGDYVRLPPPGSHPRPPVEEPPAPPGAPPEPRP